MENEEICRKTDEKEGDEKEGDEEDDGKESDEKAYGQQGVVRIPEGSAMAGVTLYQFYTTDFEFCKSDAARYWRQFRSKFGGRPRQHSTTSASKLK
jgi:hypothetical protein